MKSFGIDESGRGSLIGPMVIGYSVIDSKLKNKLLKLGVKDAKLLSRKQRDKIIQEVKKLKLNVELGYKIISSKIVDSMNLNLLETIEFSKLIVKAYNSTKPDVYYIDAFVPKKSIKKLKGSIEYILYDLLGISNVNLKLYNKCEGRDLSVALASIYARYIWDNEIDKIRSDVKNKFNIEELGSLYTPDHRTLRFIRDHFDYPEVRKSFKLTGINWRKVKNEIKV